MRQPFEATDHDEAREYLERALYRDDPDSFEYVVKYASRGPTRYVNRSFIERVPGVCNGVRNIRVREREHRNSQLRRVLLISLRLETGLGDFADERSSVADGTVAGFPWRVSGLRLIACNCAKSIVGIVESV